MKSKTSRVWDFSKSNPPGDLWAAIEKDTLRDTVVCSFQKLILPKTDAECRRDEHAERVRLCRSAVQLTEEEKALRMQACEGFLDITAGILTPSRRAKKFRHVGRPSQAPRVDSEDLAVFIRPEGFDVDGASSTATGGETPASSSESDKTQESRPRGEDTEDDVVLSTPSSSVAQASDAESLSS